MSDDGRHYFILSAEEEKAQRARRRSHRAEMPASGTEWGLRALGIGPHANIVDTAQDLAEHFFGDRLSPAKRREDFQMRQAVIGAQGQQAQDISDVVPRGDWKQPYPQMNEGPVHSAQYPAAEGGFQQMYNREPATDTELDYYRGQVPGRAKGGPVKPEIVRPKNMIR